jgi:magnesium transporter
MTENFISIKKGIGVRGAMSALIAQAADKDNVSTIYVVDNEGLFIGAIELTDLIVARQDTPLETIINTDYPRVCESEPTDECIEQIRGYSEDQIPVLDVNGKLIGVLTAHEITQVIEDEIGDDYAKLGGLSSEEELHEPLMRSLAKRFPWLLALFFMGFLVSSVIGAFENVVASLTLIVSFQSLILGMAGNVGTQSLAVTIRTLSDEDLSSKKKISLVLKEARVGLCNGLLVGSLSFVTIGAYLFLLKGENASIAFSVSLCIGIAMLISMLLASISGTAIPMILEKMNIDPAVASGPFITTINDLVAVVTYYGLAWALLINVFEI